MFDDDPLPREASVFSLLLCRQFLVLRFFMREQDFFARVVFVKPDKTQIEADA